MLKSEQIERACFLIKMGNLVDVVDASSSRDSICIGDFRDIGWSTRVTTRDSLYYEWNGPHPVKVNGEIINPGESTEEIEMDWS
jgi:hypothetical protein|tara:strand:+ start:3010 stop:3261 length:252 start_codon:yes stop_codon:yes gene_type:complete